MGILNASKKENVFCLVQEEKLSRKTSGETGCFVVPHIVGICSQLSNDAHNFLGAKGWRHLVVLVLVVNVEKLESIGDGRLLGLRCLPPCLGGRNHKRLCALVHVILDLGALVLAVTSQLRSHTHPQANLQPAHHAVARINRIVHRVEADVAVATTKRHLDHDTVVNVVQVFPDVLLAVSAVVVVHNQVAACSLPNLAGNMARQDELSVVPLDLNLTTTSDPAPTAGLVHPTCTYPLVLDVQVMPADEFEKLLGLLSMEKGNRGRAFVRAEEHIQQHAATHGTGDVGMGGALGEVQELDGSGGLPLILLALALILRLDVRRTNDAIRDIFVALVIIVHLAVIIRPGTVVVVV